MRIGLSRLGRFVAWAIMLGATPVLAQMQPPPRHEARSPTGVSYRNGSFSFEEEDLSIGGAMPDGLSLVRSYNSATNGVSDLYVTSAGWTSSLTIYITATTLPRYPSVAPNGEEPPIIVDHCIYNLVGGPRAIGFYNITEGGYPPTDPRATQSYGCGGNIPGTYVAAQPSGDNLEFVGAQGTGHFVYTGGDGSVIKFTPTPLPRAEYWTMPNGTRLDFFYAGEALKSVFSNRGWAIIMESKYKACAVNLAQVHVAPGATTCPADAQTVTYQYSPGPYSGMQLLTGATKAGATRTYRYAGNDHVDCIVDPGQTACKVENTYFHCPEDASRTNPVQPLVRLHDPVIGQAYPGGKTYTYSYAFHACPHRAGYSGEPDTRPFDNNGVTIAESTPQGLVYSTAITGPDNKLLALTDPLSRTTSFGYSPPSPPTTDFYCCQLDSGAFGSAVYPEQNWFGYGYDERGNITVQGVGAKPDSGLPNLATTAHYPATCANIFTCNKPEWTEDPKLARTDFEYDPAHGGVRIEKAPADANGVRPVKRHTYVQRTAWLKNSSGGYTAATPAVWLLSETRTCRTSTTVGNACAAGSADEVVTAYDYGPDSGPNNLLLRGTAVTADVGGVSTTLRTCYGYDRDGRKISETSPSGTLGMSACP